MEKIKSVCILMSTYNGMLYLREQVDSLLKQKNVSMKIYVRDDGSSDGTQNVLEEYAKKYGGKLIWYQGENIGPAKSFLDLIYHAPDAEYYAFCDQDDVWEENKLSAAVEKMQSEREYPCLYFSNVKLVDSHLSQFGISKIDEKKINLKRLLFHNIAIGCTIVFNKKLLSYLKEYIPNYIWMHDWWVFQVCLAINGKIIFDKEPHILYRQHDNNCLGIRERKINLKKALFQKSQCSTSRMAMELFKGYKAKMTKENIEIVGTIAFYKNDFKKKCKLLMDNDFYRDTGIKRLREKIAIVRNRI